jgi:hypothetical protein
METWVTWIVGTPLSRIVMGSDWLWPIAESLHYMGLMLLVGTVGLFDLRVLGLGKGMPPAVVHKLVRVGMLGFALSAATGVLFIAGQPDQYFYNRAFHWKLLFLGFMGLNVTFFYTMLHTRLKALGPFDDAPLAAKLSTALSLLIMIGVMCAGRLLTFFRP